MPSSFRKLPALSTFVAAAATIAQATGDVLPADSFAATYGSYAPAGDCSREPRIEVAATGLAVTVGGHRGAFATPDIAWSYGGDRYDGIGLWLFPYTGNELRPLLFALNADEQPGVLQVIPHDAGYDGGPALSARDAALVAASPYRKCPA